MENYKERNWLHQKYTIEQKTVYEIADLENISISTVSKYMKKHGIKKRKPKGAPPGEKNPLYGRKLSKEHRQKLKESCTGENNFRWNGGIYHSHGYIKLKNKSKYLCEHRLVMEELLDRKLLDTEIVHHINEDRNDNRPENLHLFKTANDHTYYHWQINKGNEIELKYCYEEVHNSYVKCAKCSEHFRVRPYEKDTRKYCSRKCSLRRFSKAN